MVYSIVCYFNCVNIMIFYIVNIEFILEYFKISYFVYIEYYLEFNCMWL